MQLKGRDGKCADDLDGGVVLRPTAHIAVDVGLADADGVTCVARRVQGETGPAPHNPAGTAVDAVFPLPEIGDQAAHIDDAVGGDIVAGGPGVGVQGEGGGRGGRRLQLNLIGVRCNGALIPRLVGLLDSNRADVVSTVCREGEATT